MSVLRRWLDRLRGEKPAGADERRSGLERRSGSDRRVSLGVPPPGEERRSGADRRSDEDRRS